jgi:hypothetical protein
MYWKASFALTVLAIVALILAGHTPPWWADVAAGLIFAFRDRVDALLSRFTRSEDDKAAETL